MNNFARLAVLTYRGAFVSWQGLGYVTRIFFQPLLHVLTVVLAGKFASSPQAAEHYTIGLLAFSIIFVIAYGILEALFYDRAYGILSIMFLSPANRLMVYFGRAGIHWLNAIATFAIGLIGAWLILGLDLSAVDWASLLVTIAVMIVSSITFALLIGNVTLVLFGFVYVFQFVYGVAMLLTGAIIPVDRLPDILKVVSQVIPFTHGIVALRGSFAGAGIADIGDQLLLELAIGVGYGVVGFALFRLMEQETKRRGNLEQVSE